MGCENISPSPFILNNYKIKAWQPNVRAFKMPPNLHVLFMNNRRPMTRKASLCPLSTVTLFLIICKFQVDYLPFLTSVKTLRLPKLQGGLLDGFLIYERDLNTFLNRSLTASHPLNPSERNLKEGIHSSRVPR